LLSTNAKTEFDEKIQTLTESIEKLQGQNEDLLKFNDMSIFDIIIFIEGEASNLNSSLTEDFDKKLNSTFLILDLKI
jgi:hypothetical protein